MSLILPANCLQLCNVNLYLKLKDIKSRKETRKAAAKNVSPSLTSGVTADWLSLLTVLVLLV